MFGPSETIAQVIEKLECLRDLASKVAVGMEGPTPTYSIYTSQKARDAQRAFHNGEVSALHRAIEIVKAYQPKGEE